MCIYIVVWTRHILYCLCGFTEIIICDLPLQKVGIGNSSYNFIWNYKSNSHCCFEYESHINRHYTSYFGLDLLFCIIWLVSLCATAYLEKMCCQIFLKVTAQSRNIPYISNISSKKKTSSISQYISNILPKRWAIDILFIVRCFVHNGILGYCPLMTSVKSNLFIYFILFFHIVI